MELDHDIRRNMRVQPLKELLEYEDALALRQALTRLEQRDQTILILRLGLDGNPPRTLEQVSRYIGRTRERVRQMQKLALKKLRKYLKE